MFKITHRNGVLHKAKLAEQVCYLCVAVVKRANVSMSVNFGVLQGLNNTSKVPLLCYFKHCALRLPPAPENGATVHHSWDYL